MQVSPSPQAETDLGTPDLVKFSLGGCTALLSCIITMQALTSNSDTAPVELQCWAKGSSYEASIEATAGPDDGTVLRAPTEKQGLIPLCKDTFLGKVMLQIVCCALLFTSCSRLTHSKCVNAVFSVDLSVCRDVLVSGFESHGLCIVVD